MIKRKIGVPILTILIFLLIGVPAVLLKNKKPIQQPVVVTGLTDGQQKTFQQDLSGAMKQYGYIKKGDRLLAAGNFDDAIKEYEIALSLAKSAGTKGEALRSLADLYEKKRDYKKALEYLLIETDKYVADWAKAPLIERAKYLEYADVGKYDLAIEHAKKAIEADSSIHNSNITRQDYTGRLNDLIAAKDYILSLKKK